MPGQSARQKRTLAYRPDDTRYGTLANQTALLAGYGYTGNVRGAWAGNIAYAIGDVVTNQAGIFFCIFAHTSNNAGFQYDRNYWTYIPVPASAPGTAVPVRQMALTAPGAGFSTALVPSAGAFQVRPKTFNYSAERTAWVFQATSDVTMSGNSVAAVAGTLPTGSVVIGTGITNQPAYAAAAALTTAIDLSNAHLRIPMKWSAFTSRTFAIELTSAGTDFTNRTAFLVTQGNLDGPAVGLATMFSVNLQNTTEATVTGTGATLTAINGMRFRLDTNGSNQAFTVEVSKVAYHPNVSAKAKCILWLDDGNFTSHQSTIKTAAKYGFPMTYAYIADYIVSNSGSSFTADQLRFMQNNYGHQIAVHAFGAADHNRAQTGATLFEQLLDYQHFGLGMGFRGVEDIAYWNPGFPGPAGDESLLMAQRQFRSARGGKSRVAETLPPGDPHNTRAMMTNATDTSTGTWQPYAQKAINQKGLAQFVWHDMSATTPANQQTEFATFCAWLDANRASIDVVTPQTAFDPYCV